MTNIEAALGLAQMERIEEFLEKKKLFNAIYREELGRIERIRFQREYEEAESCWWLTAILIENCKDIKSLQEKLFKVGIQTRRVFTPVVEFPMYKCKKQKYTNSYSIYEEGLCLPSSVLNSTDDIFFVCKTLKKLI